jgi:hypothetical protein
MQMFCKKGKKRKVLSVNGSENCFNKAFAYFEADLSAKSAKRDSFIVQKVEQKVSEVNDAETLARAKNCKCLVVIN